MKKIVLHLLCLICCLLTFLKFCCCRGTTLNRTMTSIQKRKGDSLSHNSVFQLGTDNKSLNNRAIGLPRGTRCHGCTVTSPPNLNLAIRHIARVWLLRRSSPHPNTILACSGTVQQTWIIWVIRLRFFWAGAT